MTTNLGIELLDYMDERLILVVLGTLDTNEPKPALI